VIEPNLLDLVTDHPLSLVIYAHSGGNQNDTRALFSFPLTSTLQPPSGQSVPPNQFFPYLVASLPRSSIRETQRLLNQLSYVHRFTFVISVRDALDNVLEVVRSAPIDITQEQNQPGVFHGRRYELDNGHLELSVLRSSSMHQLEALSWVITEESAKMLLTNLIYHRVTHLFELNRNMVEVD